MQMSIDLSILLFLIIVIIANSLCNAESDPYLNGIGEPLNSKYLGITEPSINANVQIETQPHTQLQSTSKSKGVNLNSLYIYKDNDVVPLPNSGVNFKKLISDLHKRGEEKKFSVVPLIVPVDKTQKAKMERSVNNEVNSAKIGDELVDNNSKIINEKPVVETYKNSGNSEKKIVDFPTKQFSNEKRIIQGNSQQIIGEAKVIEKTATESYVAPHKFTDTYHKGILEIKRLLSPGLSSCDYEEDVDNAEPDNEVIHKILENIEELMEQRRQLGPTEGLLCSLNGSWISEAGGVRLDICYKKNTRKKFRINLSDRIPPTEKGFLCNGKWIAFGEMPFRHSGLVIVLAVHPCDKHIATFIGECRTCEGCESVTGCWLIGRSSKDCRDQKAAHMVLADVWMKETAHTLQRKHLEEMGMQETTTVAEA